MTHHLHPDLVAALAAEGITPEELSDEERCNLTEAASYSTPGEAVEAFLDGDLAAWVEAGRDSH